MLDWGYQSLGTLAKYLKGKSEGKIWGSCLICGDGEKIGKSTAQTHQTLFYSHVKQI